MNIKDTEAIENSIQCTIGSSEKILSKSVFFPFEFWGFDFSFGGVFFLDFWGWFPGGVLSADAFSMSRGVLVVSSVLVEVGVVASTACEVLFSLLESGLMLPPEYGQAGGNGPLFVGIVISCLL